MAVLRNKRTGNYYIRVKYHNKTYRKVIGKDRRTAEIALSEVKQDIRLAKLANQNWEGFKKLQKAIRPKTFAEAAKDYMEERANYKASSIRSYKSILDKHLLPTFGSSHLAQLTESHSCEDIKSNYQASCLPKEPIILCSCLVVYVTRN